MPLPSPWVEAPEAGDTLPLKTGTRTTDGAVPSDCPTGIELDEAELQVAEMREGSAYPGVHVRVVGRLGNARITSQVDVGFGDVVVDPPAGTKLLTRLDRPAPTLSIYPVDLREERRGRNRPGELPGSRRPDP